MNLSKKSGTEYQHTAVLTLVVFSTAPLWHPRTPTCKTTFCPVLITDDNLFPDIILLVPFFRLIFDLFHFAVSYSFSRLSSLLLLHGHGTVWCAYSTSVLTRSNLLYSIWSGLFGELKHRISVQHSLALKICDNLRFLLGVYFLPDFSSFFFFPYSCLLYFDFNLELSTSNCFPPVLK